MDIDLKSTHYTEEFPIRPLTIEPLTIADVQKIAPVGVHIKELNQIAPLSVDSLRVDHVRHVDPLRIDRLNVTHLPTVNLTLGQLPAIDLNVRRVPPVAITLQQQFELPSRYTVRTRVLGFEVMRLEIDGKTRLVPRDCARREQSRTHERSFPDVAAAGNPAIPTRLIETCAEAVTHTLPMPHRQPRNPMPLQGGAPRFNYSLPDVPRPAAPSSGSTVGFGG